MQGIALRFFFLRHKIPSKNLGTGFFSNFFESVKQNVKFPLCRLKFLLRVRSAKCLLTLYMPTYFVLLCLFFLFLLYAYSSYSFICLFFLFLFIYAYSSFLSVIWIILRQISSGFFFRVGALKNNTNFTNFFPSNEIW